MVAGPGAELVLDAGARTAESPVWDPATGQLRWVDIPAGSVHALDPGSGVDIRFTVGGPVGAVLLRARGGLLLVVADGFATCTPDGGDLTRVATVGIPAGGGRMNDGACDPTGRVWAGSMHPRAHGRAALFRLDEQAGVRQVLDGVSLSNGLDWSPDGRTFYYADTPTRRVDAFDVDLATGTLSRRRRFATVARGEPDGLCVDADGCVWVALWRGGAVQRFTPRGRLDLTVDLPVARVTACAFGGSGLDTLYVTTAQAPAGAANAGSEHHAGGIFAIPTTTTGTRPGSWSG